MKNAFFIISVFFLFSCERSFDSSKTAKVSFELPSLSKKSEAQTADFNSSLNPSSVDDFNCYGLFVTGPELELRRNFCGRKSDSSFPKKSVGLIAGGVAMGSTLNLTVPAGNDRVFTLVGFKTKDNYCPEFISEKLDESKMSKPHFIGEIERVNLNPGENKTLQIQMKYDSNAWFDDCQGPDFNLDSSGGSPGTSPTPVYTVADSINIINPAASYLNQSQCYPLVVELKNGSDLSYSQASRNISITKSGAGTYLSFYNSTTDCINSSSSISNINIEAETSRKLIYYKSIMQYNFTVDFLHSNEDAVNVSRREILSFPAGYTALVNSIKIPQSNIVFQNYSCVEAYIFSYDSSNNRINNNVYGADIYLNHNLSSEFYMTENCSSLTPITRPVILMEHSFARVAIWKSATATPGTYTVYFTPSDAANTALSGVSGTTMYLTIY